MISREIKKMIRAYVREQKADIRQKKLPRRGSRLVLYFLGWNLEPVSYLVRDSKNFMWLARMKSGPDAKKAAKVFSRDEAVDKIWDLSAHGWVLRAEKA
jgi:hypothetical protein